MTNLIAAGISTEASMAQILMQMYTTRLAAGVPDPQHLPMNVSDLAQRLSSSRETTNRLPQEADGPGTAERTRPGRHD